MADGGFKRKLTAILSADVAGYSRLMAEDETATVKTIASYREIMASLIKQHRGRVVDSPGDNVLAEFSSVVDAVQCAVAVQKEIETPEITCSQSFPVWSMRYSVPLPCKKKLRHETQSCRITAEWSFALG
jgi:hypothetical protein